MSSRGHPSPQVLEKWRALGELLVEGVAHRQAHKNAAGYAVGEVYAEPGAADAVVIKRVAPSTVLYKHAGKPIGDREEAHKCLAGRM